MDLLGSVHGSQGYLVILLSLILTMIDGFAIFRRIITFFRNGEQLSIKGFWKSAILDQEHLPFGPEYEGLVSEEPVRFDKEIALSPDGDSAELDVGGQDFQDTARWANDVHRQHSRRQSATSEGTLYGSPTCMRSQDKLEDSKSTSKVGLPLRIGNGIFAVLERFLVFAALSQLLSGVVVYTGMTTDYGYSNC